MHLNGNLEKQHNVSQVIHEARYISSLDHDYTSIIYEIPTQKNASPPAIPSRNFFKDSTLTNKSSIPETKTMARQPFNTQKCSSAANTVVNSLGRFH